MMCFVIERFAFVNTITLCDGPRFNNAANGDHDRQFRITWRSKILTKIRRAAADLTLIRDDKYTQEIICDEHSADRRRDHGDR